jgi:hypothetical protein
VREGGEGRLDVSDETGRPVFERYFAVRDGEIRTVTPVMPSMLTLDQRVIRQDCLGYLMERYSVPRAHHGGQAEAGGVRQVRSSG